MFSKPTRRAAHESALRSPNKSVNKSASFLYALGTIALWSTLAAIGVALQHVPPFLLTGLALTIGSVPGWYRVREWRVPWRTLALGIYGLFGYHLLLFIALRHAPAVEANLVNYLWPLLIVLLSPLVLPGMHLGWRHAVAGAMGFCGAAVAIAGGAPVTGELSWGFIPAAGAAFVWATYSLGTQRVPLFPTSAIGLFCLVSGVLSLTCHVLFEPAATLAVRDWALIAIAGLGPLGLAFFMWDKALKLGDPREIGILSYITPLASTLILALTTGRELGFHLLLATLLIVGAALFGLRRAAAAEQ
ncbi:MAG: DMT family transporter [Betaproteobacteria bacterium]